MLARDEVEHCNTAILGLRVPTYQGQTKSRRMQDFDAENNVALGPVAGGDAYHQCCVAACDQCLVPR